MATKKLFDLRYQSYLQEAKKANVDLNITYDNFFKVFFGPCYYCGEHGKNGNYIEITKRDKTRSYDENNIIGCCHSCRDLRNEVTIEKLCCNVREPRFSYHPSSII